MLFIIHTSDLGLIFVRYLEEQCLLNKGTDEGFTSTVNKQFAGHPRFQKPKFQSKERECFTIVHGIFRTNITA